jgi:arginase family enzyme
MTEERLNLPFTGIATFAKVPLHEDLATIDADVAILGAPYDLGTRSAAHQRSTGCAPSATTTPSSTRSTSTACGSSTRATST